MTPLSPALRAGTALAALAALAFLLSLPLWANPGIVFLTGSAATAAVFATSWNLLFHYTGLVSFGHAGFFAVGAYIAAVGLKLGSGLPFLLVLAMAGLGGALASLVVGILVLRRSAGIYFAILTLALGQVLYTLIGASDRLGREDGLSAIPRPRLSLGPAAFDLAPTANYYAFLIVACAVLVGAMYWLLHGPLGRVFRAIRQDPERIAFMGIDVHAHRLLAFTIGGTVAALAGALQAPWTQIVTPDLAHWHSSTNPILHTLLGGASSFFGPAVGAALFTLIGYATRNLVGVSELVTGGFLLAVVLLVPGGILGLLHLRPRGPAAAAAAREVHP